MGLKYKRIVLKLSGETLMNPEAKGCFDPQRVAQTAGAIKALHDLGMELGVVMGGGNIWRGRFTQEMDPVNADQMGMLATIINALCVADALRAVGVNAQAFSAQQMDRFARLYTAFDVDAHLRAGGVALLCGGSGHPFFTTDTAAALRAAELKADALFKGTNVDGVYDCDPRANQDAVLIRSISYKEAVERGLRVMDATAFQLCMEAGVPALRVFNMDDLQNIVRVAQGDDMGTTLTK